ncbi:hypothetical protein SAMN05421813_1518 [Daejeonella rubra]|uniref:Uncharacterized protein n=1 Tax=Daejeonella rubra TaxID=990371 RepID=A0A1G9Z1K8_9SPHI|nr:hypothetical protein SAMN05421813_1518 [Daejeonella rubra]
MLSRTWSEPVCPLSAICLPFGSEDSQRDVSQPPKDYEIELLQVKVADFKKVRSKITVLIAYTCAAKGLVYTQGIQSSYTNPKDLHCLFGAQPIPGIISFWRTLDFL